MQGRRVLQCCLVIWTCLGLGVQGRNVLLIVGDEAGFPMGVYNKSGLYTPNLNALAASGLVFSNAYTSDPSSSPSRSVLLTGLPNHQNGMYGSSESVSHFSSFNSVTSLPLVLRQNRVRTGIIGKKDVTPDSVYQFDFEATEENYDIDTIGRNITLIKQLAHQFINNDTTRPFFLYVGLGDPSRCTQTSRYGQFCENMGNGQTGMGSIPDWKPVTYGPGNVSMPYYLPDNMVTRQDLANMYTAYSRLDQGVGLLLSELETAGVRNETLVIYTSGSSIAFPCGKDNLYESGSAVPLIVSNPLSRQNWGRSTGALSSTVDLVPTMLDWYSVSYPSSAPKLTGKSLLPLTVQPANTTGYDVVFSSHSMNLVSMYYPMRAIRTPRYRLIHNLNYHAAFSLSPDIATSPTFINVLNATAHLMPTVWFKSLKEYFFREQWELFDLSIDPHEVANVAYDPAHNSIFEGLRAQLAGWQNATDDPWRCLPAGVLVASDICMSAGNSEP